MAPTPPRIIPPTNPSSSLSPIIAAHPMESTLPHRRVSKKLQKRRHESTKETSKHCPFELPDRFRVATQKADDEEDISILPRSGGMTMDMNQSIFGLIAAAGTRGNFADRFDGHSSDEDGESEDTSLDGQVNERASKDVNKTTVLKKAGQRKSDGHKRKLSGGRLLQSLPNLSKLKPKSKKTSGLKESQNSEEDDKPDRSPPDPSSKHPAIEVTHVDDRPAPVMSRILEAQAEMAARPSFDLERLASGTVFDEPAGLDSDADDGLSPLAKKLVQIFQFDQPEEVIEEYPCWLLQSVLLQGYMYITTKHVCYYAYLPKKANEVVKSGYLSKSGKHNPKFNRYWFRLKGDVLAYYQDPSNLYFPSGQIDIRYGISATVTDKDKEGLNFQVVTPERTFHFKADSAPSAKEWVKSLQRVIFRSHNEGDSVKISLPIENIIDVEDAPMVDYADTCKLRVVDNDETYAIDEYFFSFFAYGKEAINVLKILVEDNAQRSELAKLDVQDKSPDDSGTRSPRWRVGSSKPNSRSTSVDRLNVEKARQVKLTDSVRATLPPMSPVSQASSRGSAELQRSSLDIRQWGRRSMDLNQVVCGRGDSPVRRSFSDAKRAASRDRMGKGAVRKQESSDSYVQSVDDPSQASISALMVSSSEEQSASQILQGSDVFHQPTVRRSVSATRHRAKESDKEMRHKPKRSSSGLAQYTASQHAASTGPIADVGEYQRMQANSQNWAKMGSFPLQRASAYAGWLNKHTKRMSNLLATESMGYVEKVQGMWKGGRKHYDEPAGLRTDDEDDDTAEKTAASMDRFRQHFALPETEKLQATYFGYLMRVLPLYGKIYISNRSFCFRSLLPGTRTKLILPLKDIENVDKEKGFRFGYQGLVVVVRGHEELFFEFRQVDVRDDCAITLLQSLETVRYLKESTYIGRDEKVDAETAVAERDALKEARHEELTVSDDMPRHIALSGEAPTILFDDPRASFLNFKPPQPLRVTCLTIGSRGDVQPYIALCKGLKAEGHHVKIATHAEFEDWVRGHGIDFATVEGDPGELMRICIENGTFTFQFLKEANSKMREWLDLLLTSAWTACQGSDILIESPSAMAGIHIAERLQIPYFRAFTMPWTRTRAYPHAFIMPEHKLGGAYNYITYVMFDNVFWKATSGQINRWRNKTLGLPNTNLDRMAPNKIPFLYNFSSCVVPPPLDYSDWIRVTGYWFLDEGTPTKAIEAGDKNTDEAPPPVQSTWTPPQDLADFIAKARADKKKLVYVGFGSILVPDPAKMTQEVIEGVLKSDVRCILSKGWSDRMVTPKDKERAAQLAAEAKEAAGATSTTGTVPEEPKKEVELPPEIFQIKSAPHDWLFQQIDAAAHHGGSGTTGASLRAGIPTIIRPFFGDQFFFGSRVEDLGVGICLKKWGGNSFARALWEATKSERMILKAKALGEQIRKENGVENAINSIYRDMEYAKSLIKAKAGKNAAASGTDDDEPEPEEWTFVEDDIDPMRHSQIFQSPTAT